MNELVKNPYEVIEKAKHQFEAILAADDTGVDFEKESVFAYQSLIKNKYILDTALKNPASVKMAVINIASVGLSLNPATSYAYLVPRDGAICLDISYQGLIKIATDSGSIKWCQADLVYANDKFEYNGPAAAPTHTADPFSKDRGDFVGVYSIAKTVDDDYLVEVMSAEEIYKIRDEASPAAKKQSGPWYSYFGEMAKKACIKRAQKTWPKSHRHERLQNAVKIINETEGSDWGEESMHRWKPGEAAQIAMDMKEFLQNGDELGVKQLVEEYTTGEDPEEAMKFWALFKSTERSTIKALMNDEGVL